MCHLGECETDRDGHGWRYVYSPCLPEMIMKLWEKNEGSTTSVSFLFAFSLVFICIMRFIILLIINRQITLLQHTHYQSTNVHLFISLTNSVLIANFHCKQPLAICFSITVFLYDFHVQEIIMNLFLSVWLTSLSI